MLRFVGCHLQGLNAFDTPQQEVLGSRGEGWELWEEVRLRSGTQSLLRALCRAQGCRPGMPEYYAAYHNINVGVSDGLLLNAVLITGIA
eukprot:COSAG02_NODE_45647_length_355_cov_0.808594_1_plen_89_part_00